LMFPTPDHAGWHMCKHEIHELQSHVTSSTS
jgi:hypothetical protein